MIYKKLIPVLIIITAFSCNSEKRMIEVYNKQKAEMAKMKELSQALIKEYDFEYTSLRYLGGDVGIRLSVHGHDAFTGVGEYYNLQTLKPMEPTDSIICDSCLEKERAKYAALLKDRNLAQLLSLYVKTDPDAIQINSRGLLLREILAGKIDTVNEISIAPVKMITNKYGHFFIVKVACYAGGFCDTYHLLRFNPRQHFSNSDIIGLDAGEDNESIYFGYVVDTDTSLRIFKITADNYSNKKSDTTTKTLILK